MINREDTSPEDDLFSDWTLLKRFTISFERPEWAR